MKNLIKKWREKYRQWNTNRKLIKAKRLIMDVYKHQLPGTILRYKDNDVVVTDIVFSLRKNHVSSVHSKIKQAFTRKQRAAIYSRIDKVKQINEYIG